MFHSDPAIEDRVIVIRDVTRGVHAADVRLAVLVDDNAVVHVNTAAFEELHCRLDPDAHDDEVAFETQASFGDDVRHASGSLEGGDGVLEDRANTVSAMEVGDASGRPPRRARGRAAFSTGRWRQRPGLSAEATPPLPSR